MSGVLQDSASLRADLLVSLRSEISSLRSDILALQANSTSSSRVVESSVVSDLQFLGDAKEIDGFLITIRDVMEANICCFIYDARKVSWVA